MNWTGWHPDFRVNLDCLFGQNDMGRMSGCDMLADAEAKGGQVNSLEHSLTLAKHDRRDCKMDLVNQTGTQILAHCADAAADLHIPATGSSLCLRKRRLNAARDEMECRAALHLD